MRAAGGGGNGSVLPPNRAEMRQAAHVARTGPQTSGDFPCDIPVDWGSDLASRWDGYARPRWRYPRHMQLGDFHE